MRSRLHTADEYLKSGFVDDILLISSWVDSDDNRNVPYLNWNDDERNLNLNWFDNDWNDNYRFFAVRKYLYCSFLVLQESYFFK